MSKKSRIPTWRKVYSYDLTATPPGVNVTTAAWTELSAALADDINALEVFDSSGSTLKIGYGPAGSEVDLCYIPPGGMDGRMDVLLNKGMRVAIKAVDANATVGSLVITGYK